MKSTDDTIYGRIIECLHRFGQGKLANKLVDINEELLLLKGSKSCYYIKLAKWESVYVENASCIETQPMTYATNIIAENHRLQSYQSMAYTVSAL